MKTCSRCKIEKPLSDFNKKGSGRYQPLCRPCDNTHSRSQYKKNGEKMRKQIYQARLLRRDILQEKMIKYLLEHPCVDCSERDIVVLEFDHLRDKEKNVSELLAEVRAWDTILKEIKKCDVVCANCHRRRTATRGNWYKS